MVYLPATLAQQIGAYRDQQLDVSIQNFPGGAKSLEALLGGSVDVVCGFYDHTIQMAAEGRELISFVTMVRYAGYVMAVSPATSKKIRRIEDLKGAVVGVTAPGSSTHLFLNYLLVKHGMSAGDVSSTLVGAGSTAVAAMDRGKVDAAVMTEPAFSQLAKRHANLVVLADVRYLEGVEKIFNTHDYPSAVFYVPTGWVKQNPQTARRLAQAMKKTLEWMAQHTPEEIMEKMPATFRGDDRAVYLEALRHAMPTYSRDGLMTVEGAEAVKKVLSVSIEKVRLAKVDISKTYTNEFLSGN